MGDVVREKRKKTKEMYDKSKQTTREQTALRFRSPNFRLLTSSVTKIQRKKHEIKVLLQHM